LKAGHTLPDVIAEELETNKSIYGFVRPYSNRDERLDPFIEKLKSLNFDQGEHYKLVFDVEAFLAKGKMKPTMNIAILLAAVCLDHGITGFEYWLIMSPCFIAGFLGCYTDALHNPPQTLFPISCEMIEYVGKQKKRSWIEE
jgi:citrate synthase